MDDPTVSEPTVPAAGKYHVPLTSQETAWLQKIDFSLGGLHGDGHAAFLANQKPILSLLQSLSARKAIPHERVKYWNDPQYNYGRTKGSRRDMFVKNGNHGDEVYTHPHFLEYLRYFLFGADLPAGVIAAFEAHVGNPDWITSSNIVPMAKFARQLIRQHHLERSAADEFYKLCLDMGLGQSRAATVREIAKRAS